MGEHRAGRKGREEREMVRVWDPETREVTSIPAAELAPGMVRVTIDGMEGDYWMEATTAQGSGYRHPPFDEEIREILREIQKSLQDVYPMTLAEWEDGFRRDTHPKREIALWAHTAETYQAIVAERQLPLTYKKDVFRVLATCMSAPRDKVMLVLDRGDLTRAEARPW